MEKSKVDGKVSCNGHISHGLASSTGENTKTNLQSPKDAEFSTVSSERVQQTSVRSEFSAETGLPYNAKRKVSDSVTDHNKVLKTDSSSSKESGEVVQLSSVDSTDILPCLSSNEIFVERKPSLTQSGESQVFSQDRESSVVIKSSDSMAASLQSSRHCNFDLNEGMEAKGAISVVAKVGVPMGKPKKPLQFGGELGWRRGGSASAFRVTSVNLPDREKETCSNRGFDLNVAVTMDSDLPATETPMDAAISNPPGRFLLDLNSQSENVENHDKQGASSFDLNNNPMTEGTHKNLHEHNESRPFPRKSVAADSGTTFGGNVASQIRPPAYWVDLSSMRGFGHVQQQPFLVATTPSAEQVQMVVPSGLYIGKINNLSPTFYPPSGLAHLNNQHGAAAISQVPGSVLTAYPGPVHFIQGPQGPNPHAYANMRPAFFPNGSIPLVENGSRGVGNAELLIPVRNGLFEIREKPVEQVALPASQNNYRHMASWN